MRIKHRYLTWDSNLKIIKPVLTILDKNAHVYSFKEDPGSVIPSFIYQLEFYLYEDDPAFDKLKKEIDRYLKPQYAFTEYEKTDINRAEWFIINTGEYQYPQPADDFGYLTATFNLQHYCKECGIGKVQQAPFRLSGLPKQPNNQFWGLHWEFDAIFVRNAAKHIIEQSGIQGIRFSHPVLHKKSVPVEEIWQMHIDTVLDKGFDPCNTQIITCKINNEEGLNTDPAMQCCGRIKYHHPKVGGYIFDPAIFDNSFDIVNSAEYFGSGGSAFRLQLVSRKFKALVEKNKLKGLSFIPVMHERFQ